MEGREKAQAAKEAVTVSSTLKDTELSAFLAGKVIPIEEVNDGVFSAKVLGGGIAIEPTSNLLVSPVKGVVCQTMENSGHAVGLRADGSELEILLHVGLDTVDMKGDGFDCMVKEGDRVEAGAPLIRFDTNKIAKAGHRAVTMLVVTDEGKAKNIRFHTGVSAVPGQAVVLSRVPLPEEREEKRPSFFCSCLSTLSITQAATSSKYRLSQNPYNKVILPRRLNHLTADKWSVILSSSHRKQEDFTLKTKDKLVIGYLGNGKSVNRYHLPFVLQRKETIRVKKIYDRHPERIVWERVPGIEYTGDLNSLLHDPEIQAVVCAVPAQAHFETAKAVLEAGKHCVLEKPFTHSKAEAEELFRLAREQGVHIQCYQNRRFDSDFLTVQKVIASGKLGTLLEVEMHYDYYRPETPEGVTRFSKAESYLYNHACHTIDQVISFFGKPDSIHYDVRQLLGPGRMNDYFDLDFYYGVLKVSVKSSYFRVKERPSFVLYGTKGMFIKAEKDRQEADLKKFYLPGHSDFGVDLPEHYGTLTYYDADGGFHEEKVVSERGDYGRYYDALCETLLRGKPPLVTEEQTVLQMEILENGLKGMR